MAPPGTYSAQGFKSADGEIAKIGEPVTFEVVSIVDPAIPAQDIEETLKFQMDVAKLQNAVSATSASLNEALERLTEVQTVLKGNPKASIEMMKQARDLELKLKSAAKQLGGDEIKSAKYEQTVPSIGARVGGALFGTMRNTYGVTQTQRDQVEIARTEFAEVSQTVKSLLAEDVKAFEASLDEAGIPWTSGRPIPDAK